MREALFSGIYHLLLDTALWGTFFVGYGRGLAFASPLFADGVRLFKEQS